MISAIDFEPFNYLVRALVVDEPLRELDPAIAGGFPLALFAELKRIDSPGDWKRLHDRVNTAGFQAVATAFSDIDCYFLRGSPVWEGEHRWLVAEDLAQAAPPPGNPFGISRREPPRYNRWANGYQRRHAGRTVSYQVIKQPQTSVEYCLAYFDLKISCIAWHRGQVYCHETFEDAFDRREIEANPMGFERRRGDDVYARMFTANRIYKYAERLGFSIADELQAFCSELYAQTRSMDLESDEPLRNAEGEATRNPVPSSAPFQRVAGRFRRCYEDRRDGGARAPAPAPAAPAARTATPGRKLTIGMATYDDYDGVYFSVQAIRLFHREVTDETEILVVDNHPSGPCADALASLGEWVDGYRYVADDTVAGTAVRDRIFREARSDYVLCIDSHVLIEAGAIRRLIDYFQSGAARGHLLQGPLLMDDLNRCSTHFRPEWRDGMYGVWDFDERGAKPANEPFDIPMQGLGLFACRREDWPGLNPRFRGFGGEEGYIHHKFRARGGRTLCLPFLRWVHRFQRPMGPPYENNWEDRIRNYLIGFRELGLDCGEIEAHFSDFLGRDIVDGVRRELEQDSGRDAVYG